MKRYILIIVLMVVIPSSVIASTYYVDSININSMARTSVLTGTSFGLDNSDMVAGISVSGNYLYIGYVRKDVSSYTVIVKSFGVGMFIGMLAWGLSRVGSMYSRMTR